jgi:hypothetical protein
LIAAYVFAAHPAKQWRRNGCGSVDSLDQKILEKTPLAVESVNNRRYILTCSESVGPEGPVFELEALYAAKSQVLHLGYSFLKEGKG